MNKRTYDEIQAIIRHDQQQRAEEAKADGVEALAAAFNALDATTAHITEGLDQAAAKEEQQ